MSHTCHANQCPTSTPEKFLMCPKHWYMVPKNLQAKVWETFKGTTVNQRCNSIPYMEACADAVEHVARLEGKNTYNSYRNIANLLFKKKVKSE